MKTLGIIGGMGPEATHDLYGKIIRLTPAARDQEHLHVIIDSYARIPDRTACIMGRGEDPTPFLVESALRLEKAGAEVLCMPCNTAHHFLPAIMDRSSLPFISIVDSAVAALLTLPVRPKAVYVMATAGTLAAGVYELSLNAHGMDQLPMPENLQQNLMHCIYEGVKKGKTLEVVPLFQSVLDALAQSGPDALIAACTELPLLLEHVRSAVPVVDATQELARKAVEYCLRDDGAGL
ncbi:amino acid racemase [Desulfovibrio sp. OttesenSCG-928-A18]|nr:amino acid racemase [Desulfovibrio sp. OttesenSCG-928-A18]